MFACIHIPDFPVQASLLADPPETRIALSRSPIAILEGPANLPRVFAANSAARRAGIQLGMTKLQAEVCSRIELRKRSLAQEESAQSTLLDCTAKFSPRVESTAPGTAILDLTGTEKLFSKMATLKNIWPTDHEPWPRALRAITTKSADAGFDARIAIARNPDTALLAARGFPANTIIPSGEEAQRLAPLPIEVLPLSAEMLETLTSWGIRTFQSLAALPEVAIVERLGQDGLYLQKLARGTISRPLLTAEPEDEFAATFEFDDPVETLESIFFILNRLLDEICYRLIAIAQAASELRLTVDLNVCRLAVSCGRERRDAARGVSTRVREDFDGLEKSAEDDTLSTHEWKLPVPTQDKNLLFSLVRLQLEKISLSAPVRRLRLEVVPVKPRLAQGNLFVPPAPAPEKLELTLERIRSVVGATDSAGIACVGSPHLLDTHKPDSFILTPLRIVEADSPASKNSSRSKPSRGSPVQPRLPSESCHPDRSTLIRAADQRAKSKLRRRAAFRGPQTGRLSSAGVETEPRADIPNVVEGASDPYSPPLKCPDFSSPPSPATALRIFRPALETAVELEGEKPHFVRLWGRPRRVFAASGPWSTSGNWWNSRAWMREEWDIAIQTPAGLGFYRIYRDRLRRQWFVEGVFD